MTKNITPFCKTTQMNPDQLFQQKNTLKPIIHNSSIKPETIANYFCNQPWFSYLRSPSNLKNGYSIIGLSPFIALENKVDFNSMKIENKVHFLQSNKSISLGNDVFEILKKTLQSYELEGYPPHLPFTGGLMGYLSYDLVYTLENLPKPKTDPLSIPAAIWVLYDLCYIFDHENNIGYFIAINVNNSGQSCSEIKQKLQDIEERLIEYTNSPMSYVKGNPFSDILSSQLKYNLTKGEYLSKVEEVRKYIRAGDIYQANLTYRYQIDYNESPFHLFQKITENHPTPYSAYFNFPSFKVLSFSPERLVQCQNRGILVQPMKGTRPRGKNTDEDLRLKNELLSSDKDKAELIMIVDLLRNDLGKVSEFGTVSVESLMNLEEYSTVFQLTSKIKSILSEQYDLVDLIKAIFPSGSITGCPKIRAMEILTGLEQNKRSLFMGSMGYISLHKTMDLNVAIRTVIHKDQKLYFQVGGGIVYDSDPEKEYQETLDKSAFLFNALNVNPI